jgi:DNA-3-methyladenine glycosylase II
VSLKIKRYLQECYPQISEYLSRTETIPRIERKRGFVLPEAVVRVVVGQMLSGKAAETIYGRVRAAANAANLSGSWLLDVETLRGCGLSKAKANAILELSERIGKDSTALDYWYDLAPDDLLQEIKVLRGMGAWSAGILALFYVGHEDIFPSGDGSLDRALRLIAGRATESRTTLLDPTLAAPYRSYLALYLWQCLDAGLFGPPSRTPLAQPDVVVATSNMET